jgi:hypothetical protein
MNRAINSASTIDPIPVTVIGRSCSVRRTAPPPPAPARRLLILELNDVQRVGRLLASDIRPAMATAPAPISRM